MNTQLNMTRVQLQISDNELSVSMQEIKENLTSEVSNYILSVLLPSTTIHRNKRSEVEWRSKVAHFVSLQIVHSYQ